MKSCSRAVLFFDTDQSRSISTGGSRLIKTENNCLYAFNCCSSSSFTCLDAVFFVHIKKKKNIHSIALHEKKAEHALEPDEKIVACFFIATFLAYAMKSIITFL